MTTEALTVYRAPASPDKLKLRQQKQQQSKKYFYRVLIVLAVVVVLAGVQTLLYYSHFIPRVNEANGRMVAFMQEKTSATMLEQIHAQFQALIDSLKDEDVYAKQVLEQFEILAKHFRGTPLQTADEIQVALVKLAGEFQVQGHTSGIAILTRASTDISRLADDVNALRKIYTVQFDQLQADLENPPWYLWPAGYAVRNETGYLAAVTYNRAMYLSQIGETGTARVLLTGLYASTEDESMLAMIYYGFARLQWELFMTGSKPENYFQAVRYLRQSIQANPDMGMAKRLMDFLLSLSEGDSAPQAEEGNSFNPAEGEAASITDPASMF